jgi:putative CocE/NonD family hydrolase
VRRALLVVLALTAGLLAPVVHAAPAPVTAATAYRENGYLTTSDGTRLKWTVLRPRATGRFPVLMQYEGYQAGNFPQRVNPAFADEMLAAGYAVLGVSMRGTACSGGVWDPFLPVYGQDGKAAVEWAARQRWSTGKVGMFSFSFAGIMQLHTALNRPRGLAAVAPGMVVSDTYRDIGFPGGILNDGFPPLWDVALHESWAAAAPQAVQDRDPECLANIAAHQVANEPYSLLAQGLRHTYDDGWHHTRSAEYRLNRIAVPVLGMGSAQDEQVGPRGVLAFDRLRPETTWTVQTNGYHGLYADSPRFRAMLHRFFDRYLKGTRNGWERTPHVQLFHETRLSDKNPTWVTSSQQRPFPTTPTAFYLQPGGGLAASLPRGAGTATYAYPTASPLYASERIATGSDSGATWQSGRVVPGGYAAFTTPPLAQDLSVTGTASLDAWITSTAPDADVQVTVTEVRPDGRELYVQRGWLRLSHRALDRHRSTVLDPVHVDTVAAALPVPAGKPVQARIEVPPFTHVFRAGSRLRVWLDTPSVTGLWSFLLSPTPSVLGVVTDPSHPSRLVLGRVPGDRAPGALPPCGSLAMQQCRPDPLG